MRPRVALFGFLGTVATALAAAVLFAPGAVGDVEPLAGVADVLAAVNTRHLLVVASALVGVVVTIAGWRAAGASRAERDEFDVATAGPPESVTTARQRRTAADLDEAFEAAIHGDVEAAEAVRERLCESASRTYARSTGCDLETARTAVADGTWTDDPTAAAALAADDGPTHSLGSRLRLWLDPESERQRRFARTVRETTRLANGPPSFARPAGGDR